jgi:predicted dinucleotide-binding enzyme
MRIGILGSGLMGAKLGTIFARAGHQVVFSYARSEEKLKRLARKFLGVIYHTLKNDCVFEDFPNFVLTS